LQNKSYLIFYRFQRVIKREQLAYKLPRKEQRINDQLHERRSRASMASAEANEFL